MTFRTKTTCSSESDIRARSTAVWVASSASLEPSVARRILVGKMLISFPLARGPLRQTLRETYDVICQIPAHHIDEGGDRVAAWTSEEPLSRTYFREHPFHALR